MGYKAVYPAEAIEAHRAFIAQRRTTRPSEEYRTPTEQEWDSFLAHFEKRKVSVGTCARAFGSPCIHEHACVRCSLLRPDPAQRSRLEEIRDNLEVRIIEAKREDWLGEVEGLQVSWAGAKDKITQIDAAPLPTRTGRWPRRAGTMSCPLRSASAVTTVRTSPPSPFRQPCIEITRQCLVKRLALVSCRRARWHRRLSLDLDNTLVEPPPGFQRPMGADDVAQRGNTLDHRPDGLGIDQVRQRHQELMVGRALHTLRPTLPASGMSTPFAEGVRGFVTSPAASVVVGHAVG